MSATHHIRLVDLPEVEPQPHRLIHAIGNTPLVTLAKSIQEHVPAGVRIDAKLESHNPGGSVKDRTAWGIIRRAERKGLLQKGRTLLDASSGNTAIAYAMLAADRGYPLKICMPASASLERKRLLQAYNVDLEFTDPLEGSDGAIQRARQLARDNPKYYYADQYNNPATWKIHYETTGPEIWHQTQGQLTHFVAGLGTSGTFTGTTRFLKRQNGAVQTVAVQPDAPFHGLEGLKHMESSLVPGIYDTNLPDAHWGADTEESLWWIRRLARTEGLLVGPSSGAALAAAVALAQKLENGYIVVIFCDHGSRYLSESHVFGGDHAD
jgi:cysteine synthase B